MKKSFGNRALDSICSFTLMISEMIPAGKRS